MEAPVELRILHVKLTDSALRMSEDRLKLVSFEHTFELEEEVAHACSSR